MTEWRIDVPMVVPGKRDTLPLNSNDRLHYQVKGQYVAQIRETVGWRAKGQRIPPQDHVVVQLHYLPGTKRHSDASNLMASQKPAVDGLVDAGIVPDDTARWVTELMPVIHEGQGRALWLIVRSGRAVA